MTSRKVKDFTQIASKARRRSPLSKFAKEIEEILSLEPPEGLLLTVPSNVDPEKYRHRIRAMVTRRVVPYSAFRFKVTVAIDGSVLVGCYA